jgi:hypothetical protein
MELLAMLCGGMIAIYYFVYHYESRDKKIARIKREERK